MNISIIIIIIIMNIIIIIKSDYLRWQTFGLHVHQAP